MTEQQWLSATEPDRMLGFLSGRASDDRKLRLYAVACYRRVWHVIDARTRQEVEVTERRAEGQTGDEEVSLPYSLMHAPNLALFAVRSSRIEIGRRKRSEEGREQARLLREMFGNPFRPVTIDPSWLTSDVLALAQGIYDEKAFDRMPILHDALMDAGCTNPDLLDHCRQDGHVRGCWVIDLLLGKS